MRVGTEGNGRREWTAFLGWASLAALTALAAWFRFHDLALKPLHGDEGVNGWFLLRLVEEGHYRYNAMNYHGPFFYHLSALALLLGGKSVESLRFVPALAGTLAVPLLYLFRPWLGWAGVLAAGAFLAVAPLEVYFSRTAIHETLFVTLHLLWVGALARWVRTRRRVWLVSTALALAMLFATKETTVFTLVACVAGALVAARAGRGDLPFALPVSGARGYLRGAWAWARGLYAARRADVRAALWVFGAAWLLLFSSFFLDLLGPPSFFVSFFAWAGTGAGGAGHEKPFLYYLVQVVWPYYTPLLIAGGAGLLVAARRRERLALFSLTWLLAGAALYSGVPYKTPWCVLPLVLPLFLGVGYAARDLARLAGRTGWLRRLAGAAGLAALWACLLPLAVPLGDPVRRAPGSVPAPRLPLPAVDAWTASFVEYDDPRHPFVYGQPVRACRQFVAAFDRAVETARATGVRGAPRVVIVGAKNPARWHLARRGSASWTTGFDAAARAALSARPDIVVCYEEDAGKALVFLGPGYVARSWQELPWRRISLVVAAPLAGDGE